jgi:hypothetical protein
MRFVSGPGRDPRNRFHGATAPRAAPRRPYLVVSNSSSTAWTFFASLRSFFTGFMQ